MARATVAQLERFRKNRKRSLQQLSKVLTEPLLPLTASERLVAMIIFQHANPKTLRCYPSIGAIRQRGKVSKNTVHATITKLKHLRLVKVEKRRLEGRWARNEYDFTPLLNHVPIHRARVDVHVSRDTK